MNGNIGEKLRKLRLDAGYDSLGELYRASGVPVSTLSRIEANVQKPRPETLEKLAPYLQISYEHLMAIAGYLDANNKQNSDNSIEKQFPQISRVLRRNGKRITPADERRIARIIEVSIEDTED